MTFCLSLGISSSPHLIDPDLYQRMHCFICFRKLSSMPVSHCMRIIWDPSEFGNMAIGYHCFSVSGRTNQSHQPLERINENIFSFGPIITTSNMAGHHTVPYQPLVSDSAVPHPCSCQNYEVNRHTSTA